MADRVGPSIPILHTKADELCTVLRILFVSLGLLRPATGTLSYVSDGHAPQKNKK